MGSYPNLRRSLRANRFILKRLISFAANCLRGKITAIGVTSERLSLFRPLGQVEFFRLNFQGVEPEAGALLYGIFGNCLQLIQNGMRHNGFLTASPVNHQFFRLRRGTEPKCYGEFALAQVTACGVH